MKITRRTLVDRALKGSLLCLTFKVGGASMLLTPAQARAKDLPILNLNELQSRRLEVLAEAMVPGATDAGVLQFVDHQLGEDPNEALLIAKYFQVPLPYVNFYVGGLGAASAMSEERLGKPLQDLNSEEATNLVREMSAPGTVFAEFPVFLFYMCLRSDAVDVVYGTPEGFRVLNVPYMEHILPPEGWNA